jgi:hypothetical protein
MPPPTGHGDQRGPKGNQMNRTTHAAAAELVRLGYRALSKATHPDAGGSHADMIAATAARDWLSCTLKDGASA